MITLVGPGGVGKSRLALQVAWEQAAHFPHGAYFVQLTASTPESIISTLADAIGFSFYSKQNPKLQLLDYLRAKKLLLVLDNFEHLLSAAGICAEILEHVPEVRLLITSRECLHLLEECIFEIHGLDVPEQTGEQAREYGAVQLFLQRIQHSQLADGLRDDDLDHIVRICRLLGGLPLAIELAAVWVRALSLKDITREIERDLDFLVSPYDDQPPRHRGLRTVFEHSWNLLAEAERQVLARLSIFQGRISRSAAEQVAGASPQTLLSLVDGSLLRWNAAEEYYELHPVLRQYSAEKLAINAEEANRVQAQHCAYFTDLLTRYHPQLRGHGQLKALNAIKTEIDNIHQAWQWAIEHEHEDLIERSLESIFWFYIIGSRYQEGLAELTNASEQLGIKNGASGSVVTWKLLARQGVLYQSLGREYQTAEQLLQGSLQAVRDLRTESEIIFCLIGLGKTKLFLGDDSTAQDLFQEALALTQNCQSIEQEADTLSALGLLCQHQEDYSMAKVYHEQALSLYRKMGDRWGEGQVLNRMGIAFMEEQDIVEAHSCYEQALQIIRELGSRNAESHILNNLGLICLRMHNYEQAQEYFLESRHISHNLGDWQTLGITLVNLGILSLQLGIYSLAHDQIAKAQHLFADVGYQRGLNIAGGALGTICREAGDVKRAIDLDRQCLAQARKDGNRVSERYILIQLGHALAAAGKLAESAEVFHEGLSLYDDLNQQSEIVEAMAGLANVYLGLGDRAQAMHYAESVWACLEKQVPTGDMDVFSIYLNCYRVLEAYGDARSVRVLNTAQTLLEEQAEKLHDDTVRHSFLENVASRKAITQASQQKTQLTLPTVLADSLTRQEREVLSLMAEGLTNRDIAEHLVITIGTVKIHTHNIYGKLEVKNRTQAVCRARDLGLL
ncbi:MAG: tetratricopeptide repeat protein [Anaerolineae bacterium]|nr:tetratricopeptide repeat protein [Anaerolineae bacterium]